MARNHRRPKGRIVPCCMFLHDLYVLTNSEPKLLLTSDGWSLYYVHTQRCTIRVYTRLRYHTVYVRRRIASFFKYLSRPFLLPPLLSSAGVYSSDIFPLFKICSVVFRASDWFALNTTTWTSARRPFTFRQNPEEQHNEYIGLRKLTHGRARARVPLPLQ